MMKDTTRIIFDALNSRDLSQLEEHLAEDALFEFPGTELLQGPKKILLFFKILFRKYPRLQFHVRDVIVENDQTCAIWTNEGQDSKGNPYKNRGITLVRVKDGKIVFISDYFKDTSFVEAKRD